MKKNQHEIERLDGLMEKLFNVQAVMRLSTFAVDCVDAYSDTPRHHEVVSAVGRANELASSEIDWICNQIEDISCELKTTA